MGFREDVCCRAITAVSSLPRRQERFDDWYWLSILGWIVLTQPLPAIVIGRISPAFECVMPRAASLLVRRIYARYQLFIWSFSLIIISMLTSASFQNKIPPSCNATIDEAFGLAMLLIVPIYHLYVYFRCLIIDYLDIVTVIASFPLTLSLLLHTIDGLKTILPFTYLLLFIFIRRASVTLHDAITMNWFLDTRARPGIFIFFLWELFSDTPYIFWKFRYLIES